MGDGVYGDRDQRAVLLVVEERAHDLCGGGRARAWRAGRGRGGAVRAGAHGGARWRAARCWSVWRPAGERTVGVRVQQADPLPARHVESRADAVLGQAKDHAVGGAQLEDTRALRHQVVEAERFVEAYRKKLQLEAASRSRPLPPLCACGLDPLDNHTDNCARNCIFFKNPQAYGRALSGLFVRPIILD